MKPEDVVNETLAKMSKADHCADSLRVLNKALSTWPIGSAQEAFTLPVGATFSIVSDRPAPLLGGLGSVAGEQVVRDPGHVHVLPLITAQMFEARVGRPPVDDDLARCNCTEAGQIGHLFCGWDSEQNLPRSIAISNKAWEKTLSRTNGPRPAASPWSADRVAEAMRAIERPVPVPMGNSALRQAIRERDEARAEIAVALEAGRAVERDLRAELKAMEEVVGSLGRSGAALLDERNTARIERDNLAASCKAVTDHYHEAQAEIARLRALLPAEPAKPPLNIVTRTDDPRRMGWPG